MIQDTRLLKALRGEATDSVPLWFMRQAGRFLPEYRELRTKHSMLELIRSPCLAAEVTLQPLRRFDLDAAIIFADILTPLIGMGIDLDFVEGEGPKISNPLATLADVERLAVPAPQDNVNYTLEAIDLAAHELAKTGDIPLIGFSGAPFTLSAYLIEGGSLGHLHDAKRFMLGQEKAWVLLQEKLSRLVEEYAIAQVTAGAKAIQLFDSWVGYLGPNEFERFAAPYLTKLISNIRERAKVPVIYFSTGTAGILQSIGKLGASVIGVDWRISLERAARLLGIAVPLQGNLDPCVLAGPQDRLEQEVLRVLEDGRTLPAHIFNLGHGVLPHTPIGNVEAVISIVRSFKR